MLVALKLYDGIHDMFENLRACQCALLVDVTDENHRYATCLGEAQQCRGALPHLSHTARTRLHLLGGYRLYRVDHHNLRIHLLDMFEYPFERCLAEDVNIVVVGMWYAFGAHLQLVGALLATYVQDIPLGHLQYCLQCQSTLAYARFTTKQDD